MNLKSWKSVLLVMLLGISLSSPAPAAIWKAAGEIRFAHFYAEMNDQEDPVVILLRLENHSTLESLKISRDFVKMTDAKNRPVRPVLADEVVSGHLQNLRKLLPRHAAEIDELLGEIQADFPQEKIVEVYGRLKKYMKRGRPITWRTGSENFFLGKRQSSEQDITKADMIIAEIGKLSENYFWPTDVAAGEHYTRVVFFKKTLLQPVNIFFQIGEDFIGTQMKIAAGDQQETPAGLSK